MDKKTITVNMMIELPYELKEIFKDILSKKYSLDHWSQIESDDMFQEKDFVGGFDANEQAFCFSFYRDQKEYWFQVKLENIPKILEEKVLELECPL